MPMRARTEESMTPEIVSVVLTGAGVLFGVWRIHAHSETALNARIDAFQREVLKDMNALTERMARLEGALDGFIAGFKAKDRD